MFVTSSTHNMVHTATYCTTCDMIRNSYGADLYFISSTGGEVVLIQHATPVLESICKFIHLY